MDESQRRGETEKLWLRSIGDLLSRLRPTTTWLGSIVTLAIFLIAYSGGCGRGSDEQANRMAIRIGLFEIVEHPSVDALRIGFEEAVHSAGPIFGRSVEFDVKNAHNDMSLVEQIADRFIVEKPDLVFVMGTPCAVSLAAKTNTIPIIVGGMTDPVQAGVADSWQLPGRNVTGTSDLPPVEAQFKLAQDLIPNARRVGVLYNSGESNSVATMNRVRAIVEQLGWTILERTATTTAEVPAAANSLIGRCDVIYLPPDNTVNAALESVLATARAGNIPVFGCVEEVAEKGGLFVLAVDYSELGKLSGRMAIEVLKGKRPAEMPIRIIEAPSLVLNIITAEKLGISLPSQVLLQAARTISGNK